MSKKEFFKRELAKNRDFKKAEILQRFFKTGKGEYGSQDVFLGVSVPKQRETVNRHQDLSLLEIIDLLHEKIHEYRLSALMMLINKYKKGDWKTKKEIVEVYLKNTKFINNWDLVDLSAPCIVGDFFLEKDKKRIEKLIESDSLWEKRIAMVSTLTFIRNNQLDSTYLFAEKLLQDKHDLIHKVVGWMLREAGKKDKKRLVLFLEKHAGSMPRTTLRYSIEKFNDKERKRFLGLKKNSFDSRV
jgi:3-methyladenine DNA glycosylase AlkD